MDIVESFKDKSYVKYKFIVKKWENNFKAAHSRTPTRHDIKEAPQSIKLAYKKYYHLKTEILETSLSTCEIEDTLEDSPEPIQLLEEEILSPQKEQLISTLPSGQEIEKLLSEVQSPKQARKIENTPFTDNLSKKLFQNRKFSIRNPRKLSIKSQNSNEKETCINNKENDQNSPIADDRSDIVNFSFTAKIQTSSSKESCVDKSFSYTENKKETFNTSKAPNLRQIDPAWLERATGENFEIKKTDNSTHESIEKFGLRNINSATLDNNHDFVDNSESEEDTITLDKLKPALKRRKLNENGSLSKTQAVHSNLESTHNDSKSTNLKKRQTTKRKTKETIEQDKIELQPDISDYLPPSGNELVTPRHTNISNVLKTVPVSTTSKCSTANKAGESNQKVSKLESKFQNGTVNDNFVRINIEKKVFARGKKGKNFTKYKKQQWKDRKALNAGMEFPEAGKITCFKCNGGGHFARYCTAHKGDTLLPLEGYSEDSIPTLEDMKNVVSNVPNVTRTITEELSENIYSPSQVPDSFLKLLGSTPANTNVNTEIKPLYSNSEEDIPTEINDTLQMFGYNSFRPGQEKAIMRVLCGLSTLLILPTGGGKSLCYQMPAYIYSKHYKCITLVISPLVSLMEDQVISMPEYLKAGCLHTNQPPTQRQKIMQMIKDGELNILLLSPEALISGDTSSGFAGLFKSLPPIAFACIDEAHCVSQWSHNFRPSYLMLCKVLREKLNVKCILGLTATASQSTIESVIKHINVSDGLSGVITNPRLPNNLCLSVSFEKDKDRALLTYLTSERISKFNSIIVYCIRRDECERVATVIRSCLQASTKFNLEKKNNKRKRMSYIAEAYHAGMSAAQRKRIQKNFMDGSLRIIVATVAFGMGINKSDIRSIIHYNMPSSFESYVQEVGRAGRDGQMAYCHTFMSSSSNDKDELLKHIHANTIDRPVLRKLLQKIFIPCECGKTEESNGNKKRCRGHEVAIPIDRTIEELDVPEENIATLLCYLELHHKCYIKVLSNAYINCKILSYGGFQKILEAAKACPPLAMAYLIEGKKDPNNMKKNIFEFNVIEVAAAIGWESGVSKYHLKNLEWTNKEGNVKRSQLKVEFNTLGFKIKAPGDLDPNELDDMLDDLYGSVKTQEKARLYQLEEINKVFANIANYSIEKINISDEVLKERSDELKSTINTYFQREDSIPENITFEQRPLDVERVKSDVRALICTYKDCSFSGRSIARIFQGISSPNYPALVWGKCKFWRSHIHEDFYGIVKIAAQIIVEMK